MLIVGSSYIKETDICTQFLRLGLVALFPIRKAVVSVSRRHANTELLVVC
jgi:hypothetical protein